MRRAALFGGLGYAEDANDEVACIVMIETREGLDNLEASVATAGLGGVYIGPSDLGLALGLGPKGDSDDPIYLAAVSRILETSKAAGVPVGIHTASLAFAKLRLEAGFEFVTLGSDLGFMMQAVRTDLMEARKDIR